MTEPRTAPEPETFCSAVRKKMDSEGRKWSWLAVETGIHVNTLRSQIIYTPSSLKYSTSLRVASALHLTQWPAVSS